MFDFDRNRYPQTHMPFAFEDLEVGCVKVGSKWKIHRLSGGVWERIETGLPVDATECSPTICRDEHMDRIMTWIGGASMVMIPFRLFRYNLDHPDMPPEPVCRAAVGYEWKGMVVHGNGSNEFTVDRKDGKRLQVRLLGVEYLYRITLDPHDPRVMLLSAQHDDGSIHSYALDLWKREIGEIMVDGEPVYKPCKTEHGLAYAVKCGEGFEDREIRSTDHYEIHRMDYDRIVETREERATETYR